MLRMKQNFKLLKYAKKKSKACSYGWNYKYLGFVSHHLNTARKFSLGPLFGSFKHNIRLHLVTVSYYSFWNVLLVAVNGLSSTTYKFLASFGNKLHFVKQCRHFHHFSANRPCKDLELLSLFCVVERGTYSYFSWLFLNCN